MLAISVDDRPLAAEAIVQHGRAFVPLRAVGQALGATVRYEPRTHRVIVRRFGKSLTLRPRIVANRAFVPLRFVAQWFGAVVGYDARLQLVRVSDPAAAAAASPGAITHAFSTPLPVPPPWNTGQDAPAYAENFNFYTEGARAYYPGDWMHFVLIAPPGGSASLELCNLGYRYQLTDQGYGNRYEVNVPVPNGLYVPNCLVSAQYTSWSGRARWVDVPLYIGLYTGSRGSHRAPRPSPSPASSTAPPPGRRRPEPTPGPVVSAPPVVPKPVRTREPVVQRTPPPRPGVKPTP
ncbi:MAG: copper amine oxidase N-terminal domain-containing protein [Candidatus Baltobacteraceae bacterium]